MALPPQEGTGISSAQGDGTLADQRGCRWGETPELGESCPSPSSFPGSSVTHKKTPRQEAEARLPAPAGLYLGQDDGLGVVGPHHLHLAADVHAGHLANRWLLGKRGGVKGAALQETGGQHL